MGCRKRFLTHLPLHSKYKSLERNFFCQLRALQCRFAICEGKSTVPVAFRFHHISKILFFNTMVFFRLQNFTKEPEVNNSFISGQNRKEKQLITSQSSTCFDTFVTRQHPFLTTCCYQTTTATAGGNNEKKTTKTTIALTTTSPWERHYVTTAASLRLSS